jgi:hypothetical protein
VGKLHLPAIKNIFVFLNVSIFKPYDLLKAVLILLFNPSTTPLTIPFLIDSNPIRNPVDHPAGLFEGVFPTLVAAICIEHIFLHHPMGIEERTIDGNGIAHHIDETVAIMVVHRKDDVLQFVIY